MLMRCACEAYTINMSCTRKKGPSPGQAFRCRAALQKRTLEQPFERSQRRHLGIEEVIDVDQERLLHHVLPAHRGVQHLVAEADPGGARSKVDPCLRARALEVGVGLG